MSDLDSKSMALVFLVLGLMWIMVMGLQWGFKIVTDWIAKKLEKK